METAIRNLPHSEHRVGATRARRSSSISRRRSGRPGYRRPSSEGLRKPGRTSAPSAVSPARASTSWHRAGLEAHHPHAASESRAASAIPQTDADDHPDRDADPPVSVVIISASGHARHSVPGSGTAPQQVGREYRCEVLSVSLRNRNASVTGTTPRPAIVVVVGRPGGPGAGGRKEGVEKWDGRSNW